MSADATAETRVSARTAPPFRADHVGSLLRPRPLTEARAEFKAGRLDREGLRAVEDDAIRELRCDACGTRAFSSAAAELVAAHVPCPRCGDQLALVPDAA